MIMTCDISPFEPKHRNTEILNSANKELPIRESSQQRLPRPFNNLGPQGAFSALHDIWTSEVPGKNVATGP